MPHNITIKICGVQDAAAVSAVAKAGVQAIGLVLYPPSKRAVTLPQARALLAQIPPSIQAIILCVDPDDALLREVAGWERVDILQLHGHESPRRVAAIRGLWSRPIMKALPIATAEDFTVVADYAPLVERFLFDTKAPAGAPTGGNGVAFDWRLLAGRAVPRPWFLAGGLNASNVASAIQISGARAIDVSSGVENATGQKDAAKIADFCQTARNS